MRFLGTHEGMLAMYTARNNAHLIPESLKQNTKLRRRQLERGLTYEEADAELFLEKALKKF